MVWTEYEKAKIYALSLNSHHHYETNTCTLNLFLENNQKPEMDQNEPSLLKLYDAKKWEKL